MVGQALLAFPDNVDQFARQLAFRLRWWLLALPAGVGKATARAILKLWCGFPPTRSGVNSAGNGPAMRAALLGVCLAEDPARLSDFLRASTRLTHIDSRAEIGALLVALAAVHAAGSGGQLTPAKFFDVIRRMIPDGDEELPPIVDDLENNFNKGTSARDFAATLRLDRGVSGYIYRTVPVALFCWLRAGGMFQPALEGAIALGGDTDTVGAIVGALCGATVGAQGIPPEWLRGLVEWPCSERWMRELASRLAKRFAAVARAESVPAMNFFWPGQLLRNFVFLNVVLYHGFRRLWPPY